MDQTQQITAAQFHIAHRLAAAYGHEWASARVLDEGHRPPGSDGPQSQEDWISTATIVSAFPAEAAQLSTQIEDAIATRDGYSRVPGLRFATTHATGSGRLRWEVTEHGHVSLSVRSPGERLSRVRALRGPVGEAACALQDARRTSWDGYGSVSTEGQVQALLVALGGLLPRLADELREGVEMIGACWDGYRWTITVSAEYRAAREGSGSYQGPAPRHWLALREATTATQLPPPQWPEDAQRLFAAVDTLQRPVREAEALVRALRTERDQESSDFQRRYARAAEALEQERAAISDRLAALCDAEVMPSESFSVAVPDEVDE